MSTGPFAPHPHAPSAIDDVRISDIVEVEFAPRWRGTSRLSGAVVLFEFPFDVMPVTLTYRRCGADYEHRIRVQASSARSTTRLSERLAAEVERGFDLLTLGKLERVP